MNIKELRSKEGLSQSALAKRLGIATSAIGHMENGRMKVSAKIASKVKEEFGIDVEDIKADVKAAETKAEKTVKGKAAKIKEEVKAVETKAEKAAKATAKKAKATAQKAEKAVKSAPANAKATTQKAEKAVKKAPAKAKAEAKKAEDKVVAEKIEAKKAATKSARKAKTAVKEAAAKVEKTAKKPAAKAKTAKLEIVVQSPMGGNITAEEIASKIPAGCSNVFVRVDQNKLYWVKGEETGAVDIW